MKKGLVFLAVFFLCQSAWAAGNLGKSEIAFSKGLLLFNEGKPEQAREEFLKTIQLNPLHASASYFVGMTYFQKEEYEKALSYFNESLSQDAAVAETHFYKAVSLYRLKKEDASLAEFARAESLSQQGAIYDLSKSYHRSLTQKPIQNSQEMTGESVAQTPQKKWFVYGSLTTQYDSNVILKPDTNTAITFASDQNDVFFGLRAGGGYELAQKGIYRLVGEGNYYQSLYAQQRDFNYGLAHAELRQQIRFGKWSFTIPTSYEFSLLKTSKYLQSGALSPTASYALGEHLFFQVTERLRYDDFFQSASSQAQQRDATNFQTEPSVYFLFDGRKRHVKVSYDFEGNFAKGNDWDYKAHTVSGALYNPLMWGISSYLSASYTWDKKFKYVDSVVGVQRDDSVQSYAATVSRDLFKGMTISAQYQYQRGKSDIPFFQYKRHLAGVTFAYQY